MPTTPLLIWGASGHGKVAADIARADEAWDLLAFIDDNPALAEEMLAGVRISPTLAQALRGIPADAVRLLLAIGDNATRLRKAEVLAGENLRFATLVHPRATVARDVVLGEGTLIAAGAVVNPATRIGRHVIINTLAGVDHDCVLEDGVHIAPGAHLAGRVHVERGALVGVGAAVRDGVRIGAGSIIGAGAAVVKDVEAGAVVVGVPARPIPD